MLVSLRLAGIFDSVVGFVWGTCARCQEGSLWNVEEAVKRHMLAIGKPAVYNMAFGLGLFFCHVMNLINCFFTNKCKF